MKIQRAAWEAITRAGGPAALAIHLSPPRASKQELRRMANRISKWIRNGVPPRWCPRVSALTGVPKHALAPDVYSRGD